MRLISKTYNSKVLYVGPSSPSILIVSVKILAMGSFLSPRAQCVQSCLAITCPVITRVDYNAVGRASRFFCIIYTVHI